MRSERRFARRAVVPAVGVALGIAAAVATVGWSNAAAGGAESASGAVLDATHLPPVLTTESEHVELAYDVHCALDSAELADEACELRGTAFVRVGAGGSFTALALQERTLDGRRQLAVAVPEELAAGKQGVEYFAVLEAPELGRRIVLPAGGAEAPHVSRRLESPVEIELGRHSFGSTRRRSVRVASASWGDGPDEAGLEQGKSLGPIGASAFDVDARGNVLLLDQAHRRVLRWRRGSKSPHHVRVSVNGTLADMAASDDGSIFVLESTAPPGRNPTVRRFDEGGRELEAIESADRNPSQIRIDAPGPTVLGGSSHQWLPVMIDGTPASPRGQLSRGRMGRRFLGGVEVVVLRRENEVRIALVSGKVVTRSWLVRSDTALAEVQLAEPLGQRVVLVVRVYGEPAGDQFVVLVLDRSGLVERFAVDAADWAETAPLGRFRLVGRSLYRLGSTSDGAFVDRFDLEVR